MAGLTTLLYVLPLTLANNYLPHRTPDTLFQLIHPAWILLLTSSSHLSSLLTVEPRYLKFFALFTFFLAASTRLHYPHPQPSNTRSCSGSFSGLFSPVHFSIAAEMKQYSVFFGTFLLHLYFNHERIKSVSITLSTFLEQPTAKQAVCE